MGKLSFQLLWSDPIPEDNTEAVVTGVHKSPRWDQVHQFGYDITNRFLERNDLKLLIRSHEYVQDGHGYEVEHGGKLMRVFSARDYECDGGNGGAILHVGYASDDSLYVQAQVLCA